MAGHVPEAVDPLLAVRHEESVQPDREAAAPGQFREGAIAFISDGTRNDASECRKTDGTALSSMTGRQIASGIEAQRPGWISTAAHLMCQQKIKLPLASQKHRYNRVPERGGRHKRDRKKKVLSVVLR